MQPDGGGTVGQDASRLADPSVLYIVLNPALEESDPQRFAAFFAAFESGYKTTFQGDEAESTAEWLARIRGKEPPQPVMRIVVAVQQGVAVERVVGGVAVEFYVASRCALATYLYVLDEPELRRHGHARSLLDKARGAFDDSNNLEFLLAESEWPERLLACGSPAVEVTVARERLLFFARIGARLINIDYMQPALGPGQKAISYLRLLAIPPAATPKARFDEARLGHAVAHFLSDFYSALSQESKFPPDRSTLVLLQEQCKRQRPLTSLLPRLREADAALCFHFVETLENTPTNKQVMGILRNYTCPVLHSMETDLLARPYRERRPLRTVCVTKAPSDAPADDAGVPVEITFPALIRFNSENRVEERRWPLRRRRVLAYLAFTAFFEARVLVWHLTLRAGRDAAKDDTSHWLDELDLITLQKLADDVANQERLFAPTHDNDERNITKGVEFALPTTEVEGLRGMVMPLDIHGLLSAVAHIAQERARKAAQEKHLSAARVESETLPVPKDAHMSVSATLQILGRRVGATLPFHGIKNLLEREALCGIISCILDFDEIDDAEVRDTLSSSVALDDVLLRVHRVALVYLAEKDRAARMVEKSVGISPYLIVPQATVLCDEWLLKDTESTPAPAPRWWRALLKTTLRAPLTPKHGSNKANVLSRRLAFLESTLRARWIPNVFFYKTERQLFERAFEEGGVSARRTKAEELLLKVKSELQIARDYQRGKFEAIVAGLLGAISVLSLESLIGKVVTEQPRPSNSVPAAGAESELYGLVATAGLALVIGILVYLWKRPERDRQDE